MSYSPPLPSLLDILCEQLSTQLFGFGAEKHDDAVDALVYLILGVAGDGIEQRLSTKSRAPSSSILDRSLL
jgi:hypothetical protein